MSENYAVHTKIYEIKSHQYEVRINFVTNKIFIRGPGALVEKNTSEYEAFSGNMKTYVTSLIKEGVVE